MLELLTDIIITILILVSITFIANVKVKDNKKNPTREDDEITDDDLTELAKRNDIIWSRLSYNPNAVKLLKKRFEYEKCLSDVEYKKLPLDNKIDWPEISMNNEAVELIKERIEYEKSLGDKYEYQGSIIYRNKRNKIQSCNCYSHNNKNIMILMKDYYLSNK
jgi:hypothetical protein